MATASHNWRASLPGIITRTLLRKEKTRHLPLTQIAHFAMTATVARLMRIFTPTYAARINTQMIYPEKSRIVKPNELMSALARPVQVSIYEPERGAIYYA